MKICPALPSNMLRHVEATEVNPQIKEREMVELWMCKPLVP